MTKEITPVQLMDKAITCLYLELHESIADDVRKKWEDVKRWQSQMAAVYRLAIESGIEEMTLGNHESAYNKLHAALSSKGAEQGDELKQNVDYDFTKLYDWIMDENRKSAVTHFTASPARNIAKEIEYRLSTPSKPVELDAIEFLRFTVKNNFVLYDSEFWARDNEEGRFTYEQLYNLFKQKT